MSLLTDANNNPAATGPTIYAGVHIVSHAAQLPHAMVSLNRLINRKKDFEANDWIMDSGAFTRISSGKGHLPVKTYAEHIRRWSPCGSIAAAVSQDYMCEPFVLQITGLTVPEHQAFSTINYLELRDLVPHVYILPVIQGQTPLDYANHTRALSPHLPEGAWTGVGSLCKRQGNPAQISATITAIKSVRPDLRLHGFGVKVTALRQADIWQRLHSVDSAAWSYWARRNGDPKDRNSVLACIEWTRKLTATKPSPSQASMI